MRLLRKKAICTAIAFFVIVSRGSLQAGICCQMGEASCSEVSKDYMIKRLKAKRPVFILMCEEWLCHLFIISSKRGDFGVLFYKAREKERSEHHPGATWETPTSCPQAGGAAFSERLIFRRVRGWGYAMPF